MKKAIVTGSNGFVGSNVCKRLCADGVKVYAVVKDKNEKIDKVSFGFKNLSNALTEDSRRLFILKKDVLIKNLNSLEN